MTDLVFAVQVKILEAAVKECKPRDLVRLFLDDAEEQLLQDITARHNELNR